MADGSIDAEASDALRAQATDPSKTRKAPKAKIKPVPEAAVAAVHETLRGEERFRMQRNRRRQWRVRSDERNVSPAGGWWHDLSAGQDGQ